MELLNLKYKLVLNSDLYKKEDSIYYLNASTILGEDKRTYNNGQVQTTKKLRYYYGDENQKQVEGWIMLKG